MPLNSCVDNRSDRRDEFVLVCHRRLRDLARETWDGLAPPVHLAYDVLGVVEDSGVNDLRCAYLRLRAGPRDVARANVYAVETDLSTISTDLPGPVRDVIKKWYPDFLTFRVVEVGNFTLLGEGIHRVPGVRGGSLLPHIVDGVERIAQDEDGDDRRCADGLPNLDARRFACLHRRTAARSRRSANRRPGGRDCGQHPRPRSIGGARGDDRRPDSALARHGWLLRHP